MNDELSAIRPDPAQNPNVTQLHGDAFLGHIYHRTKRVQPSILIGKIVDRDQAFGTAEAIGNFSEEISGKPAHQAKAKAESKISEYKDNILNAFGRMKGISR